jgi:hypothetical protein
MLGSAVATVLLVISTDRTYNVSFPVPSHKRKGTEFFMKEWEVVMVTTHTS